MSVDVCAEADLAAGREEPVGTRPMECVISACVTLGSKKGVLTEILAPGTSPETEGTLWRGGWGATCHRTVCAETTSYTFRTGVISQQGYLRFVAWMS